MTPISPENSARRDFEPDQGHRLSTLIPVMKGHFLNQGEDLQVRHLSLDSRQVTQGATTLFFAIKGTNHNAHQHLKEVYQKGVRNFVIEEPEAIRQFPQEALQQANVIHVESSIKALQALAAYHRRQFDIPVIGITGSNGKTMVKEWLYQLLYRDFRIIRSPKSYNSQVGVPLAVWGMNSHHELAIFEAGISKPGEMENLEAIVQPTSGIFTNIGQAHQENFASLEQKVDEKLTLFRNARQLLYCSDHESIRERIGMHRESGGFFNHPEFHCRTWGQQGENLSIKEEKQTSGGTLLNGTWEDKPVDITLPFTDRASIENACHCWLYCLEKGVAHEKIQKGMIQLQPVEMRLELKKGVNGCILVNDSYNSDLGALQIALDFLAQQTPDASKTLILSDILESGYDEATLYQKVNELLADKGIDRLIAIGPALQRQSHQITVPAHHFPDTDAFLEQMTTKDFRQEAILIKGARAFHFERISRKLQQKAHQTILEIDLPGLIHNLNVYRNLLKPGVKTMVMVKAFSYGSGSYEIANALEFHKADYLAVAYADEGIALREAGITLPIMVMNPEPQSFESLVDYKLEPELYSLRHLKLFLDNLAVSRPNHTLSVHLKLETGMHRLGFEEEDLPSLVEMVKASGQIVIKSVFSHLAASDEPESDSFTKSQIAGFERMSQTLADGIDHPFMRHILNTGGIIRHPEAQYDMVRLGLGLYGVDMTGQVRSQLQSVSTLKTTISQIKGLKPGETVGYGRKGVVEKDARIATIAIGYADGYDRRLGNGAGYVIINGQIAPVIGDVCMDMTMVDVTGIEAEEGDEVIVFGEEPDIETLAELIGTIPYEVMTSISQRVKRVYYFE